MKMAGPIEWDQRIYKPQVDSGAGDPGGVLRPQWHCPSCRRLNSGFREICHHCLGTRGATRGDQS